MAPNALVAARTLRAVWAQITGTTLEIDGFTSRAVAGGASFARPPVEDVVYPWAPKAVADGWTFEPGYVNGLNYMGSDDLTPLIGDTALDAEEPPVLPYFADGIVAIELQVRFGRGTTNTPYQSGADLQAMPVIKNLADITPAVGTIDGTDYSYGTFAVAIAKVIGGKIFQLMKRDIFIRPYVTTILAV